MDAGKIPPTYPFHIAKAYGASAPTARPGTSSSADSVSLTPKSKGVEKLVAGKVSVAANFQPMTPTGDGAIPMYRHPADKNAAATGVSVGRSVDVNA